MNRTGKVFVCFWCIGRFVSVKACKSREPKYCSKACYAQSLKKPRQEKPKKVRGPFSPEARKRMGEGRRNSPKCKGANLYNWKGGKATEGLRIKAQYYRRKKALKLPFDAAFLNRLLAAQEGKCFFCELPLTDYKAIEHLTPVSKGGDNQNFNLVYSCKSCNSRKRQNTLEQWAIKQQRFDWLDKFDSIYATAID